MMSSTGKFESINVEEEAKLSLDDCIIVYDKLLNDQLSLRNGDSLENASKSDDFCGISINKSTRDLSDFTNFIKSQTTEAIETSADEILEASHDELDIEVLDIFPSPSRFYKEICSGQPMLASSPKISTGSCKKENFPASASRHVLCKQKLSQIAEDDDCNYNDVNKNNPLDEEDKENLFLYHYQNENGLSNIDELELSDFIINMSVQDIEEESRDENMVTDRDTINQGSISPAYKFQNPLPHSTLCRTPRSDKELTTLITPKSTKSMYVQKNYRKMDEKTITSSPIKNKATLVENVRKNVILDDLTVITSDKSQDMRDVQIKYKKSSGRVSSECLFSRKLNEFSESEEYKSLSLDSKFEDLNENSNKDYPEIESFKQPVIDEVDNAVSREETLISNRLECSTKKNVENSKKEKVIKAYKLPYRSNDENENQDINDPNWDIYKKLTTDQERYCVVRKYWKSIVVPDPNENLTFHAYRKRQMDKNGRQNTETKKFKSSLKRVRDGEDEDDLPCSKRSRMFKDVHFNSVAIQRTMDTLKRNFNHERKAAPRNPYIVRQLEDSYHEYYLQLQNARQEAEMVHKFYTGLPNQRVFTQREIETEQWDIEQIYNLFKRYYNWSGQVFNPVLKRF